MPAHSMTWLHFIRVLLVTALFNSLIAFFLKAIDFHSGSLATQMIMAQCIGLTIAGAMMVACRISERHKGWVQAAAFTVALVGGICVGGWIGTHLAGIGVGSMLGSDRHFIRLVLFSLLFGLIISYFFISREKIAEAEAEAQTERIRRLTAKKQRVEADLRALEAQMEPHFLFNTLSNVVSLLNRDPEKGKTMLADMIRYLRATVSGARESESTIGREIERIQAYLNIFTIRMGDRLAFRLEASTDTLGLPFPPAMIQPLVENAISHGLEPKPEGGEICVTVSRTRETLAVAVRDTGKGMNASSGNGTSLANIRDRLHSLYGSAGRLTLSENVPSGVQAVIEVPCGSH